MKNKNTQKIAGKAFLVQNHQLSSANQTINQLKDGIEHLHSKNAQSQDSIDEMMTILEAELSAMGIDLSNLDDVEVSEEINQAMHLSDQTLADIHAKIPKINKLETVDADDWDEYDAKIDDYIARYELNTDIDPILQLLPPDQARALLNNYQAQFGNVKWNKWDYGVVGLAALLAIITDIFIVRIPKTMVWNGKEYKGSPVTKFFNEQSEKIMNPGESANAFHKWMHKSQQSLENYAKVPYDVSVNRANSGIGESISGLSPKTHRLQSLGHDPIMGFVFGIIDIMRGTMTGFGSDGVMHVMKNTSFAPTPNIFEAFTRQTAHLLSDIPTKQGVPAPFLGVLQAIDAKSPFRLPQGNSGMLGETVSYNDLSRFMYTHGYTLQHFATMSLVPMIVEVVIRTYYKLANFQTLFPARDVYNPSKDVKLQGMLTFAHTITMGGNIVKMWLNGWNPMAFNLAEMLVLVKTAFSLIMAHRKRNKEIDAYLLSEWEKINANCIAY